MIYEKKTADELGITCDKINIIGSLGLCYLIEKDGFYYIRNRDQLNEYVYDVPVGDSLEKVLDSVNLFSWIK